MADLDAVDRSPLDGDHDDTADATDDGLGAPPVFSAAPEDSPRSLETDGDTLRFLAGRRGAPPPASGSLPGRLGRYAVTREIARGGMGVVYEGWDERLGRPVAIKRIEGRLGAEQRQRFEREARLTAGLEHPHIVPVHDLGEDDEGRPFLVMKLVRGRALSEVLEALMEGDEDTAREWSRHRLLQAFQQVCNAVAFAHAEGVLHRDLKPSNVMVGRFGEVLVLDWGVARALGAGPEHGDPEITARGVVLGTPGFMSPEQALGDVELDARSDVFSLGVLLYLLLTLRKPYRGASLPRLVMMMLEGPRDPRRESAPLPVPDELAELCLEALRPKRDERTSSTSALAEGVQAYLDGSKRRAACAGFMEAARRASEDYAALSLERAELRDRARRLALELPSWATLEEKAELHATGERIEALPTAQARAFGAVVSNCDRILAREPGHAEARRMLARIHAARYGEAEVEGESRLLPYLGERVAAYDHEGRYRGFLQGRGTVSLHSEPAGAEVWAARVRQEGLVWTLDEPRRLGVTPLRNTALGAGSWLLTLSRPGAAECRFPIRLERGEAWSAPEPVRLLSEDALPESVIHVPGGRFEAGSDELGPPARPSHVLSIPGFAIARRPVTMAEYTSFLNALAPEDPAQAWARVPRQAGGMSSSDGQYWERPAPGQPYRVPERDRDGDRWEPDWPVMGVSWDDAVAYGRWAAGRDGRPWRLPTQDEWEKAARGVDGRRYPWGDRFDAQLCHGSGRLPGRPMLAPVEAVPFDVSIYGVADCAGGVREWCADVGVGGSSELRPLRGGSWNAGQASCHLAQRGADLHWNTYTTYGFRLALDLPEPGEAGPPRTWV